MWTADTVPRSRKNQSCESGAARLCWALTFRALQQSRSEIQKPLAVPPARGFSLCPRFLLDKQPQRFFDKRRATRHASALLNLVQCFDKITWNVGIQRHTTGRRLPRPMGGNVLPNLFRVLLHAYE